eukprot:TRINITY_DN3591_c0_g1_i2.p1 TRINITY_DN3591_c0_g1~~TRINITY_DN3591_c0_g1_i2.p1  ORF type:complete len:155 (-),score=25.16 TRINITY_DN3591_c0_g1_i2:96-560(-)
MSEQQNSSAPILCTAGCGFFGNPLTHNMCSKCFKDSELSKKKEEPMRVHQPVVQEKAMPDIVPTSTTKVETPTIEMTEAKDETNSKQLQKDTTRCWSCNRKVGLLGFRCSCEYIFCSKHRYAEQHACTFDYKTSHKMKLEKQNAQVVASKIQKL